MTSTPSYAIGIDFGGTSVKLARVLSDGTIAARAVFDTTPGVESWLDAVEAALVPLRQGAEGECVGVGVVVPGFVDFDRGFIPDLTNVPGWTAVPLAAFAAVPMLSLLKLKSRCLLPWTLFLGFLPYFAVCPPFLFPFLAAFRARPSRFKRM